MIDLVGAVVRFAVGILLVFMGLSTFGIILSFLIKFIIMTAMAIAIALVKRMWVLGSEIWTNSKRSKTRINQCSCEIFEDISYKFKCSSTAAFGVNANEIGIFYMVLMITIIASGRRRSMAYMLIPISHQE